MFSLTYVSSRCSFRGTDTRIHGYTDNEPSITATCSQVKANVTDTLDKNAFANFIESRARENIKNCHDGNTMMQHRTTEHDRLRFVHVEKVCCTIICLMFFFERRKAIRAFTELLRWSFDSVFPRNRSDDHVIPYFYGIGPMSIFWPSVKREEFNGAIDFAHSGLLAEVTFWVRVRAQIVPTNESDAAWISKLDSWRVTCYMLSERTLYHRTTTTETRSV